MIKWLQFRRLELSPNRLPYVNENCAEMKQHYLNCVTFRSSGFHTGDDFAQRVIWYRSKRSILAHNFSFPVDSYGESDELHRIGEKYQLYENWVRILISATKLIRYLSTLYRKQYYNFDGYFNYIVQ